MIVPRGRKWLSAFGYWPSALGTVFVGAGLITLAAGLGVQPITGAESQLVRGGGNCSFGASLDGKKDCIGKCANNPTYSNTCGNNGFGVSLTTCGGMYKGVLTCA